MTGERPYIHLDSTNFQQDSINIYKNKELINTLVNAKSNAIAIFLRHKDYLSKKKSEQSVKDVKAVTHQFDFENVRMAGRTVGQIYYIEMMLNEMTSYILSSILLVVIFLLISFKSLWGLLVPQIALLGAMICIAGFMAWIDKPTTTLVIVLPAIMFVVSISDVIHLSCKDLELLREIRSNPVAIKIKFKEIGMATF